MDISFWGIIWTLLIGLVFGALGRLLLPGKQNIPLWLTLVAGVIAVVAGLFIAEALGVATTNGVDWIELIIKIVLAVIAVAGVSAIYNSRRAVK